MLYLEVGYKFTDILNESITSSNEEEVNSTLLASCSLFGVLFMAALCHIQEDGQCYDYLKSSFLGSPAWEKDPSRTTRPTHNFSFFFHINNQPSFSGNGILGK
jgi:hypothetical protein